MTNFKETMINLGIDPQVLPRSWETYFIAAIDKYKSDPDNRERYLLTWYRRYNKWLDLDQNKLNVFVRAGSRILQSDELYDWSCFIRYLMFDTEILDENEELLHNLIPENGLDDYQGLFVLLSFISGIDKSLQIYKQLGLSDYYILDIFGIIRTLLDEYYELNGVYGTSAIVYLPRLAKSSLHVFDGIAFDISKTNLPGEVYRNSRSGELLMLAEANQIYTEDNVRISKDAELEIKAKSEEKQVLLGDKNVSEISTDDLEDISDLTSANSDETNTDEENKILDQNSQVIGNMMELPADNLWQTVLYSTSDKDLVANSFNSLGIVDRVPRIFDKSFWDLKYSNDSISLNIYVPDINNLSLERLVKACFKAWHYFATDEDIEQLDDEVKRNSDNENIIFDLLTDEITDSDNVIKVKNPGTLRPELFVFQSPILGTGVMEASENGSDIKDINNSFRLFSLPETRDTTLFEVFGNQAMNEPVILWDEETDLQKIYKSFVIENEPVNVGGGYFVMSDLVRLIQDVEEKKIKEQERLEKERQEQERLEQEKLEQEKVEQEPAKPESSISQADTNTEDLKELNENLIN